LPSVHTIRRVNPPGAEGGELAAAGGAGCRE